MKHAYFPNNLENSIVDGCPHDVFYISPTPPDFDGVYIQINRAGIVLRTPADFSKARSDSYPYCLLACVTRGQGTVSIRGVVREIHRGELFIIPANEEHSYASDLKNPMGLVWVEFCGGGCVQTVKYICDMGGCVYGKDVFNEVASLCTSLLYQQKQSGPTISRLLYEMLMCLCKQAESEVQSLPSSSLILNYIDENLDHPLTLTEVASVFGYHPTYFCSLFARIMHTTFSKYVMERKLKQACYLLEVTGWSVGRIAQELGFADTSHFVKRFKAAKSVTPTAYRANRLKRLSIQESFNFSQA